jgi:ABC-2 type transport system ATP-binding protein
MNQPLLLVRKLSMSFGGRSVLEGVNLTVEAGEWFALLGPNGSGKTTLLRCISGQLTPAHGSVAIAGHDMSKAPEKAKRALGYAHSPERLPPLLTGRQCLEVYAAAHDLPEIGAPIARLAQELCLSERLDQAVGTYSLGMRQKLSILLALIGNPALIVLDEAFNGLDPASALRVKRELQERVAARTAAVILATHSLDMVGSYATRAQLLLEGTLARSWNSAELDAFKSHGPAAFEAALARSAESRQM